MANIYEWDCKTVDTYPELGPLNYVVFNVHWRLTAKKTIGDVEYSDTMIGTQAVSINENQSSFVEFNNLTNALVSQWVQDAMGNEAVILLKSNLDARLQDKLTPLVVTRTIEN